MSAELTVSAGLTTKQRKRQEYEARKAAAAAPPETAPEWRLGLDGQSGHEEADEIAQALADGRAKEYIAAQTEAGLVERSRKLEAEGKPKRQRRPKAKPSLARARGAGSEPLPLSSVHGDPEACGNALLADHARGALRPVPVQLPDDLPSACAEVAEFVGLVVGLRLSCGDDRPAPLGREWVAAHVGLSPSATGRALTYLARRGWLTREGNMPARRPGRRGTALYGIAGYTAPGGSDGMPVAGLEPGPVAVEAQDVGAPGPAVEPAREVIDEPRVGDAVRRGAAGTLDGVPAVQGSAAGGGRAVVGHGEARYARRPTPALLLERALEVAHSPREAAFWLACQLRDNRYDEDGQAHEAILDFAARCSVSFTSREALRILRSTYRRPPREPWGSVIDAQEVGR